MRAKGPITRRANRALASVERRGRVHVAQPSTPASHFHLLRQQALGQMHRPLIIFTPKSMLRNRLAVSMPEDFTTGRWRPCYRTAPSKTRAR